MTKIELEKEALRLPPEERMELAQVLWESISAEDEVRFVPIPDWQREVVAERLEAYRRNPEAGAPWEEAKARLWPNR